nr:hypothetical protein [Tanacetum cinerariifolium]
MELEVDNHNHNEHRSYINHTSMSRTGVMEIEYINLPSWNCPAFYDDDDDDDEESFTPLRDTISELPLSVELSGELAHIDLISTKIDEADFDQEEEICLVEKFLYDNSSPRPLEEFNSENSNAIIESFSPSSIPVEDNDFFMEEIDLFLTPDDSMPPGMENDEYDSERDIFFLEELLSNDSYSLPENESFHFDIPSSPRPPTKLPDDGIYFEPDTGLLTAKVIDSLFDESVGELTLLKSFPSVIDETDFHPEKEIRLTKRLLYDNSSPRPPKEIVSNNSNADIESFSPSPIPNEDSDPLMEEIDLSFNPDDPMPPGIKEDDDDSERDILILEELLNNYSLLLPANESYHFDIPSTYRHPAKPPDGNTRTLNIKMMGDVSDQKASVECPMIINGKNIPHLDVPLFYFYPLDQFKYGGIRSSSAT